MKIGASSYLAFNKPQHHTKNLRITSVEARSSAAEINQNKTDAMMKTHSLTIDYQTNNHRYRFHNQDHLLPHKHQHALEMYKSNTSVSEKLNEQVIVGIDLRI